jgi:hypothetical protein
VDQAGKDPGDSTGADPAVGEPPSAEEVVAAMETIVKWLIVTVGRLASGGASVHPG